jgi:hypothetical protein
MKDADPVASFCAGIFCGFLLSLIPLVYAQDNKTEPLIQTQQCEARND